MAAFVFTNGFITIATTDLSDHLRSCSIDYNAEAPETTAMQDVSVPVKSRLGGLVDWKVDLELNQDFAALKTHATLFTLVGTVVALVLQPVNDTEGATNPKFTGNAVLTKYNPMGGKVGDVMVTKCEFVGTGALTLDTAP